MIWKRVKRALVLLLAVVFFILGVIGLVLPVVPQVIFFAISIILFSILSTTIQQKIEHYTRNYPRVHSFVVKTEEKIRRIIGEI